MSNQTITVKNKETGKAEIIEQENLEMVDWGFHFFVESELKAYKSAHAYRNSLHGVKVEFAGGVKKWMVTVFNERAFAIGMDGANKDQTRDDKLFITEIINDLNKNGFIKSGKAETMLEDWSAELKERSQENHTQPLV